MPATMTPLARFENERAVLGRRLLEAQAKADAADQAWFDASFLTDKPDVTALLRLDDERRAAALFVDGIARALSAADAMEAKAHAAAEAAEFDAAEAEHRAVGAEMAKAMAALGQAVESVHAANRRIGDLEDRDAAARNRQQAANQRGQLGRDIGPRYFGCQLTPYTSLEHDLAASVRQYETTAGSDR